MKMFINLSFCVLITYILLFVNQQVVGVYHVKSKRVPQLILQKKEDGTTYFCPNTAKREESDYSSAWSDSSSEGSRITNAMKDMRDMLIQQRYGSTLEKTGRILKEWIPTDEEIKKIGNSLFKGGKYLGLSMQKDSESESSIQDPSETSVSGDTVIESKQPIAEIVSSFGKYMINKNKHKGSIKKNDSDDSVQNAPKSSDLKASKTDIKQSITELMSIFEGSLKSKRKYFEQYRRNDSENNILNDQFAPKSNDSEASTTEGKQFATKSTSTFENSLIPNNEYSGIPTQNESEDIDQEITKTKEREASVSGSKKSLIAIKSFLERSLANTKRRFELAKKKVPENNDEEASKSNHQEAVENNSPETSYKEGSEPSTPEASDTDVKLKNSITSRLGKFMRRQNSNQNSNH